MSAYSLRDNDSATDAPAALGRMGSLPRIQSWNMMDVDAGANAQLAIVCVFEFVFTYVTHSNSMKLVQRL